MPKVTWQKDSVDALSIPGVTVYEDDMGSHVEISVINDETTGKYTVTAANLAGRTTKSVLVQSVENTEVYEAYKKFKKWVSNWFQVEIFLNITFQVAESYPFPSGSVYG